jgi:hypothetical protein
MAVFTVPLPAVALADGLSHPGRICRAPGARGSRRCDPNLSGEVTMREQLDIAGTYQPRVWTDLAVELLPLLVPRPDRLWIERQNQSEMELTFH